MSEPSNKRKLTDNGRRYRRKFIGRITVSAAISIAVFTGMILLLFPAGTVRCHINGNTMFV